MQARRHAAIFPPKAEMYIVAMKGREQTGKAAGTGMQPRLIPLQTHNGGTVVTADRRPERIGSDGMLPQERSPEFHAACQGSNYLFRALYIIAVALHKEPSVPAVKQVTGGIRAE